MFLWLVGSNQDANRVSNHKLPHPTEHATPRSPRDSLSASCPLLRCAERRLCRQLLSVPRSQTVVMNDCIIRGDLANVRVGRHCVVKSRSVIRPPFKKFSKGYVIELSRFSLGGLPLLMWITHVFSVLGHGIRSRPVLLFGMLVSL